MNSSGVLVARVYFDETPLSPGVASCSVPTSLEQSPVRVLVGGRRPVNVARTGHVLCRVTEERAWREGSGMPSLGPAWSPLAAASTVG